MLLSTVLVLSAQSRSAPINPAPSNQTARKVLSLLQKGSTELATDVPGAIATMNECRQLLQADPVLAASYLWRCELASAKANMTLGNLDAVQKHLNIATRSSPRDDVMAWFDIESAIVNFLLKSRRHNEALATLKRMQGSIESIPKRSQREKRVRIVFQYARCLAAQGKAKAASATFEKAEHALKRAAKLKVSEIRLLATTYQRHAELLTDQLQFDEAVLKSQWAIRLRKTTDGLTSVTTAESYLTAAHLGIVAGEYEIAEQLARQASVSFSDAVGSESLANLKSLAGVADAQNRLHRSDDAVATCRFVLDITQPNRPSYSLLAAVTKSHLALALARSDAAAEGLSVVEQAIAECRELNHGQGETVSRIRKSELLRKTSQTDAARELLGSLATRAGGLRRDNYREYSAIKLAQAELAFCCERNASGRKIVSDLLEAVSPLVGSESIGLGAIARESERILREHGYQKDAAEAGDRFQEISELYRDAVQSPNDRPRRTSTAQPR